jgi:8-oxo-dGTP diphosphatase
MADKMYIDKLAYVYIEDGKLLMSMSKGKDTWYIPGGKRERGETDLETLTREVKEELTVEIVQESAKKYGVFEAQAHGKPKGTMVRMTCYMADFIGVLKASSEIEKIVFMGYNQKDKSSPVDHLIFDDLHQKGLLT